MKTQAEAPFQIAPAKAFSASGHRVALSDAGTSEWPVRFSSSGIKPDLLVRLYPDDSKLTKVIGVEVKTDGAHSISETLDGIQKVIALSTERPQYQSWRKEDPSKRSTVSGVTGYYLATPMSVTEGIVCRWEDTHRGIRWPEDAHRYGTALVGLLLARYGGGVLLNECPWFFRKNIPV